MALTVEEKIAKLHEFSNWLSFTNPQRVFLENMARGMQPEEAYAEAYPDTKGKALLPQTAQMLCRVGVKKALSTIGIDTRKPTVSKTEALELLAAQLRKQDLDPNLLVKLLGVYAKLSGWDKEKPKEEDEGVDLNKLVSAVENKRRRSNGENSDS